MWPSFTAGSSDSPSTPQFQLLLSLAPSVQFQPLASLCFYMIRFRKEHRVVRIAAGDGAHGFPEVSFHGVEPWRNRPFESHERYVGVMFSGWERSSGPQIVYVASNAWWEDLEVQLPRLPASLSWEKAVDTWWGGMEPQALR